METKERITPEPVTQEQRLSFLVEAFKADSNEYRDLPTPRDTAGRQRVLRSLMNVRMPGELPEAVLRVQDDYLQGHAREKGIVSPNDIPVIRDGLSIWQGDITRLSVDAVVNAANSQMLGCFVPMLTDAYNLPAKKVIHVVGPIVEKELTPALEQALSDCYTNTLDLCLQNGLRSVAFCCISTGVFRFPGRRAAEIAVNTVNEWMLKHPGAMDRVIFNVFRDEDKEYYEQELR